MAEKLKKVELFRGQGSRNWSARLSLDGGEVKVIDTELSDRKRATGSAVQSWVKFAREHGAPVAARRAKSRPAPEIEHVSTTPVNGTRREAIFSALGRVLDAVHGMPEDDRMRVFDLATRVGEI